MAELILHHFDLSPFAEKARLMLGIKGLVWRSVEIPMLMPKPDLTALTGGYRKTPVLQIGADVFCDTRLIASKLEKRHPYPTLFPGRHRGLSLALAAWSDRAFFELGLAAWENRMRAIGHGSRSAMDAAEAHRIARNSAPAPGGGVDPQDALGLAAGERVVVAADDYGRDPVTGTLVTLSVHEVAIQRDSAAAGSVVVHFPRIGYRITKSLN